MDELERAISRSLTGPFTDVEPPPSLRPKILRRAAAARRRRTVTTGIAALAIVAVAVPVTIEQSSRGGSGTNRATTVMAPPGQTQLDGLVDRRTLVRIPRVLPGRPPFEAMALGADGTVLGAPRRGSGEGADRDTGIWRAGPRGGSPELVSETSPGTRAYLWAMAVGERGYLWPDAERLTCRGRGGQGPTRTFDAGWGGRERFFADRAAFVWSDHGRALAVAGQCGGPVRIYPLKGTLETFAYPHAFVRSGADLRQVDVRDGTARILPGLTTSTNLVFAAGSEVLAWADGDTLTMFDRRSGTPPRQVVQGLPPWHDTDYRSRLTAGKHILVFSAAHQDRDTAEALIYNVRTGLRTQLSADAWAAGDWLLWRNGPDYLLARVKP